MSEPVPESENIDYTLRLCKAVLERYARDYIKKLYGKEDGITVRLEYNTHFAEQELPKDDGTKAIKWALINEVIVSTLDVNLDTEAIDPDDFNQAAHSDMLEDIGLHQQIISMQPHDEPTEVVFTVNANSVGKLAQKMGISLREMQTAILEMHDSGIDAYKAITLNHGIKQRSGGR